MRILVSDDLSITSFEMLGRDCKKIELYTERQERLVTCTPHQKALHTLFMKGLQQQE